MADLAELKQMVSSFRVSELHVLLGFAGRNKSGRKEELTQRALALVQKGCSLPIQIKIRELYRQIYPVSKGPRVTAPTPSHKDINMPVMHRHPGMVGYPQENTAAGIDYGTMNMRPIITQPPIPVNPDVRLRHLPFYDVLADIMKPSSLIPKSNGRLQEALFVFHLTPQQAQDITMSRDFRPGAKCEYTVQVQVRFCPLDTTCEQPDTFPSQIQVRVNNKPATLPNVIPTNKPNVEPKRPGRPVDITNLCRLSPTVSNAITINWAADFTKSFCVSIYLVRKLTSDILLTRLRQFGNRHANHTKALIKEKLAQDQDCEISTTSLRVSLMCPLGKMRMTVPCRASTCTHLQCFDATTFLMMNERKPTWMCPVCDKPCPYDKMIIDGYFVDIFHQSPTCSDIVFHEDGSWSPLKPQKDTPNHVVLTPAKAQNSPPSISLLPSSPPAPPPLSASPSGVTPANSSVTVPAPSSAPSSAAAKGPVIDLTLDSSDEEEDEEIDAVVPKEPSNPLRSSPVINLDTPSPSAAATVTGSPTVVISRSRSSSPPATVPHRQPSLFDESSHNHKEVRTERPSSNHRKGSPLNIVDSILQPPPALVNSSSSSSSSLPPQSLNLEAMSDADFDEFLKGLSWGV